MCYLLMQHFSANKYYFFSPIFETLLKSGFYLEKKYNKFKLIILNKNRLIKKYTMCLKNIQL